MNREEKINQLPDKPGVYLLKDKNQVIVYVGKAINIKNRVRSHFQKTATPFLPKQKMLVAQVKYIDSVVVESEIEALLLEAELIKKYRPRFNTRLKDDKSYLYIKITVNEDFPQVLTARREKLPGVQYFGPFPSAKTVRNTLRSLRHIFPYCNCNFKICQKRQSCLWTELGLDAGPCIGKISKADYREIIKHLILLLSGKKEKLLRELNKAMQAAAKKEDFEHAQVLKKQIEGIGYITRPYSSPNQYLEYPELRAQRREKELIELKKALNLPKIPERIECFDISNIMGKEATGSMVVFTRGEPDKSQYRRFKIRLEGRPDDVAMMKEIIKRRLKHPEWPLPDLLVVDGGKGQVSAVLEVLNGMNIKIPLIGLAKRLEEIIARDEKLVFSSLKLPKDSPALHILQAIRDEAHRFAIAYHRRLRIKGFLGQT